MKDKADRAIRSVLVLHEGHVEVVVELETLEAICREGDLTIGTTHTGPKVTHHRLEYGGDEPN